MAECGGPLANPRLREAVSSRCQGGEGEPINILVTGKYRVGKSVLINALFFEQGQRYQLVAREDLFKPTKPEVKTYTLVKDGVVCRIYESPGLQDGSDEPEHLYFQMIKEKCPKLHLIIYCTPFDDPLWPDDKKALSNLRSTFNEDIWDIMVIALTRADRIHPTSPDDSPDIVFTKQLDAKKTELEGYFKSLLTPTLADTLAQRIFPTATAREPQLPGIHDWRADFWLGCMVYSSSTCR